jgi:hypothetical protein
MEELTASDAVDSDRGGELFHLSFVEVGAGLEGIPVDLADGDFEGAAGFGLIRRGSGVQDAGQQ